MTDCDALSTAPASSTVASLYDLGGTERPAATASGADPNAPKSTLVKLRFMALLISIDRSMPDAPSSAPQTMRIGLERAKPVAHAARPAYELSSEMTTGMSAPPMGSTPITPSARPPAATTRNTPWRSGRTTRTTTAASTARKRPTLRTFCPFQVMGLPGTKPWSLPNATMLPVNVIRPRNVSRPSAAILNVESCVPSRMYSATPTRPVASPPNECESAMRSGIFVIGMVALMATPMVLPRSSPARIHS